MMERKKGLFLEMDGGDGHTTMQKYLMSPFTYKRLNNDKFCYVYFIMILNKNKQTKTGHFHISNNRKANTIMA